MKASLEDLLIIIGDKEVTIALLRSEVVRLKKELAAKDGSPSPDPAV